MDEDLGLEVEHLLGFGVAGSRKLGSVLRVCRSPAFSVVICMFVFVHTVAYTRFRSWDFQPRVCDSRPVRLETPTP